MNIDSVLRFEKDLKKLSDNLPFSKQNITKKGGKISFWIPNFENGLF